ncbi:hypothetical protein C7T87_12920 [Xanthomonas hortorum pv. hederae]|nr:hypothetical protein C7T87_12920 [Xanthomonas hortorum pv. hederae]
MMSPYAKQRFCWRRSALARDEAFPVMPIARKRAPTAARLHPRMDNRRPFQPVRHVADWR